MSATLFDHNLLLYISVESSNEDSISGIRKNHCIHESKSS